MEIAGKVFRRSSVRLKAIGTGHSELNLVLCSLRDLKMASKTFIQAQTTASEDLLRWSMKTENRAIQDTFAHLSELCSMWEDIQREFTEHLKEVRSHFQLIYEGERNIDQVRGHLATCEALETSLKKDIKKTTKKSNTEEIRQLEIKLAQAQRAKDLAQLEVVDKVQEHEAIKLIRVKESLLKLSDSYVDLANKCQMVFESHREIAQQLPDVQDKCIHDLRYTGSVAAKQAVIRAREKLRRYRRQTNHFHGSNIDHDDPPPPYSPSFCSNNSSFSTPNTSAYPEEMNPFFDSPSALSSDSRSFTGNSSAPRDDNLNLYPQLDRDIYSSPLNVSTRSYEDRRPSFGRRSSDNANSILYEDEEEVAGAIGGVRLA